MNYNTVVIIDRAESVRDAFSQGEALLAPFDETVRLDQFHFSGVSQDSVQVASSNYAEEFSATDPESDAGTDEHNAWTCRAVGWYETDDPQKGVFENGSFGIMDNRNPDAKWDNWTLGGRWGGWFPVRNDVHFSEYGLGYPDSYSTPLNRIGYADVIQAKNFDYHRKIRESAEKSSREYDNFLRATHGMDYGLSYQEISENHKEATGIDVLTDWSKEAEAVRRAVRQEWFAQEFVAFNNTIGGIVRDDPHTYWCINTGGRKKYIMDRINKTTVPYAFLRGGSWEERPGGEEDRPAWVQKSYDVLSDLDPEAWVMMVDCHI